MNNIKEKEGFEMTEEKKIFAPNECSWKRWVLTLVAGLGLGVLFSVIIGAVVYIALDLSNGFLDPLKDMLILLPPFAGLYIGMVLALKWIAKTSMKDFVFGVGGRHDKKHTLLISLLFAAGLAVTNLLGWKYIRFHSEVNPLILIINTVVCLLFVWMQTSWEEIIFRGLFLRLSCKNDLRLSKKSVFWGIVSSLLFMLSHGTNPEVTSQGASQVVPMLLYYFIFGAFIYFANIYFKSLMPGIIIHLLNNLLVFILLVPSTSASGSVAFFVSSAPVSGTDSVASLLRTLLPLSVYMLVDYIKHRKKA